MIVSAFSKFGDHYVDGRYYDTKLAALDAAKGNIDLVEYRFNDHIYDRFDWTKDPFPDLSLWDLYRLRAQEIRDTHDYVVLQCSGGPDSQNMLEAFVYNGIRVDEIINVNSYHTTKVVQGTINNADYFFNLVPLLNNLEKTYNFKPKITIVDEVETVQKHWQNMYARGREDICWDFGGPTSVFTRAHSAMYVPHLWQMLMDGRKVALVAGADKPAASLIKGRYAIQFTNIIESNYREIAKEFGFANLDFWHWFYHAPTTAPIVIKQAHLLKNFVDQNPEPEYYEPMNQGKNYRPAQKWPSRHGFGNLRYDIFHKIIYPHWAPKIVTPKPAEYILRPQDTWWVKNMNPKEKNIWISSVRKLMRSHRENLREAVGINSLCQTRPRFIE